MKTNLAFKTAAFILASIFIVATIFCAVGSVVFAAVGFYTEPLEAIRRERLGMIADNYLHSYAVEYFRDGAVSDYLTKNLNLLYEIRDAESGELLASNFSGEEILTSSEETYLLESYAEDPGNVFFTHPDSGNHMYFYGDELPSEPDKSMTLSVKLSVPTQYFTDDDISFTDELICGLYSTRMYIPFVAAASLIISICLLVFLCAAAGEKKDGETHAGFFDRIPYDLLLAMYAIFGILAAVFLLDEIMPISGTDTYLVLCIVGALGGFLCSALFVLLVMSTAVRIKTKKLFTNTIIWFIISSIVRLLRFALRGLYRIISDLGTYARTILALALLLFAGFSVIIFAWNGSMATAVFALILIWDVIAALALYHAYGMSRLMHEEEKLARGDLAHRVDCSNLRGSMLRRARLIGSIRDGMSLAVEERTKSERFKTELITNVSHDLKTPLTSIVNYTSLLKAEEEKDEPSAEKLREYTEILERQASKLKKLTEDLVEASKASTGNLKSEPMPLELGELITQAAGEYSERFEAKRLEPMIRKPDTPVYIMADGRHMWRIFDNLLGNIAKYALEGTRVYITLSAQEGRASAIFRNTSKYEPAASGADLSERFVRGDASRHTDGSGLGLSIAKSLTELQGGTLDILTDGDLFKVVLSFGVTETPPEKTS